jgi:ubiquinone biosynthesis protein Coq4
MFERVKILAQMIRTLHRGEFIGDAAALKLSLLGKNEDEGPYSEQALATRQLNFSPLQIEELLEYPKGTLGHAYGEFMTRNSLKPLNFSTEVSELFSRFPVSMRYIRVHDLIHVLLGFETDINGELGVYAFVGEQNYNRTMTRAARMARFVGRLMFWRRSRVREVQARGVALARGAKVLVAQPLEEMLSYRLPDARQKLGLPASD